MLHHLSYKTNYEQIGITPEILRKEASDLLALADLLDIDYLPMDPLLILNHEGNGEMVDLDTGEIQAVPHDA